MTELRLGSKLTRKTSIEVQHRPLVVVLHPGYLDIRQAGKRTSYSLSYDAIYRYAARLKADHDLAERKAERKAKKLARP